MSPHLSSYIMLRRSSCFSVFVHRGEDVDHATPFLFTTMATSPGFTRDTSRV